MGPLMIANDELRKRLDFVLTSGSFVLNKTGDAGEAGVFSVSVVPNKSGVFWVPGTTRLKSEQALKSAFRVDTDSGGSLLSVYWHVQENRYEHTDESVFEQLGVAKKDSTSFDWEYSIPLEKDVYHD